MNSSSPRSMFPSFLVKCDRRTNLKTVTSVHSLRFCFRVSPMDPLVRPEFLLLQDRSLEEHTRLFLFVANTTSYQDNACCAFNDSSLNTACRALLSEVGPREDFAAFVEWTSAQPTFSPLLPAPRRCPPVPPPRRYPPSHPPTPASSTAVVWQPLYSPSAHHQCGVSLAGLPSCSVAMVGVSLDSASEARTLPRPIDPPAPPWLLAPSSPPWPICPLAPPGSLVPPAPPWSGVDHPTPWDSSGCASSLWFRQAPSSPQLLLSPLSLRLHRSHLDSHLRLGPPDPL